MSDVSSPRAAKSAVRPSRSFVALAGLALLVLLSLPFAVNDYLLYVVNLTLVYALAAVGFNIVLGYLGQLAFANAAFFGIGAYAFAVSISVWHLPFLAALAFAAAVGGSTGFVVGLPALRLRRYYLAIVTLVFGELLRWLYIHSDGITGGSGGLGLPPVSLAGLAIDTDSRKFYVLLAVAGVMIWLTWNILSSRIGRAWTAVRENELAAASLGLSPARYKIAAFAWSGVVSGGGGRAVRAAAWTHFAGELQSSSTADAVRDCYDRRSWQRIGRHFGCGVVDRRARAPAQCAGHRGDCIQLATDRRAVVHAARFERHACRALPGAIALEGETISGAPPHRIFRKGVVQVSQGRDLFPEMSVLENLELGATVRNADLADNLARVLGYFPRLAERRQQVVGTLSGGEQQMVAIGRALMGSPRILLLDEPSGGLAPRFVQEIGRIMQTLKAAGTTMLLVEQNISLAMSVADRFYILRDGRIVHAGLSNELSTDYAALAHQYYL